MCNNILKGITKTNLPVLQLFLVPAFITPRHQIRSNFSIKIAVLKAILIFLLSLWWKDGTSAQDYKSEAFKIIRLNFPPSPTTVKNQKIDITTLSYTFSTKWYSKIKLILCKLVWVKKDKSATKRTRFYQFNPHYIYGKLN